METTDKPQTPDAPPPEKPPTPETIEQYELTKVIHEVTFSCAMCAAKAPGQVIIATVGPYRFPWVRMPAGWWLLGALSELDLEKTNGGMMLRCPKCLIAGPLPDVLRPPPRGPHSPRRPRRRRRK